MNEKKKMKFLWKKNSTHKNKNTKLHYIKYIKQTNI